MTPKIYSYIYPKREKEKEVRKGECNEGVYILHKTQPENPTKIYLYIHTHQHQPSAATVKLRPKVFLYVFRVYEL